MSPRAGRRKDPGLPACPGCGAPGPRIFDRIEGVPVHSVLNLSTRGQALLYPKGDIDLGVCPRCGLIANLAFEAHRMSYVPGYEATQTFSPTFRAFAERLAGDLIERFGLRNRKVLEIGCGQGEFLRLLCQKGGNRGIGIDPAFREEEGRRDGDGVCRFIADAYSSRYSGLEADLICCRMTLEHIPDPGIFLKTIRRALDDKPGIPVFFQVPEAGRILKETAFWDVYYEHCNYFHAESLARLFRICGFRVTETWTGYGDQYLMLAALPEGRVAGAPGGSRSALDAVLESADAFAAARAAKIRFWDERLSESERRGDRAVIWGGGSKAVAFLSALGERHITHAVDINPQRQGTFLPGSGLPVTGPEALEQIRPGTVIVMNPLYTGEIRKALEGLGLSPRILAL
jgi:SAM-dependent methyltransferase